MKEVLHIDLKTSSLEEGQRMLFDLCENLTQNKVIIKDYSFE